MIILKSNREIEYIRAAGRITADALMLMRELAVPGVTTQELDRRCEEYIRSQGAFPSCKGYYGFPATICASVNEEVVHGIPGHRKLHDGDIISVDLVVNKDGYHGDSTITIPVGDVAPDTLKLLQVTEECLYKGIEQAVAGKHMGDLGHAVQAHAEWSAIMWVTVSERICMKPRKYRITVDRATALSWKKGWSWPLNR